MTRYTCNVPGITYIHLHSEKHIMDLDELLFLSPRTTPPLSGSEGRNKAQQRSASEPAYHMHYSGNHGCAMESSKFFKFGDCFSLFSENDTSHGFISTLG